MQEFLDWLETPTGIAVACLSAVLIVVFVRWKFAVRDWEGQLASDLTSLGFPTWSVQFLTAASQGNLAGAAGYFVNGWKRIHTAAGLAELDAGYLAKMKSDPARWARFMAVVKDVDSGASAQQISTDLQAAISGSPIANLPSMPTPLSVVKSDVQNAVSHIQAAASNDPVLGRIATLLTNADLLHLFPVASAAVQAAQAAAPPANPNTGNGAPPANGGGTGNDAGAAGAAAAAPVVSAPAGHLTITAPPGTSIPAMQVPAAPAGG